MLVLPPRALTHIADRIEQAYLRWWPDSPSLANLSAVSSSAARQLVDLHRAQPRYPIDPELYVLAQRNRFGMTSDPCSLMSGPAALRAYTETVRRIIRSLLRELRSEVRRVERCLEAGIPLEKVLRQPAGRLSPLTRYLMAAHLGRNDLIVELQAGARNQHLACPLYEQAARMLFPVTPYPVFDVLPDASSTEAGTLDLARQDYSLN